MTLLDDPQLYRALVARDPRFDGVFFVGVTSTGIYCRPVCPAPTPRADRCRFYRSAAAAERRGFRPCLRCRPELAPGAAPDGAADDRAGAASVDAVDHLARQAAARIAAGALDRGGVDALAADLGVTGRHLRRVVERRLGATPVELAQTRRLLTAKQLLTETALPVTEVALASGFRSVRRFNALFQERYRMPPGRLRRGARDADAGREPAAGAPAGLVTLALAYRPPYDWPAMLAYLRGRATPGVEMVTPEGRYVRTICLHGHAGHLAISAPARAGRVPANTLRLELHPDLLPVLVPLLARLRRLLDLDADPGLVAAHLSADPALAPSVARRPGLRVPGAVSGFELALRTVLGQQVSVAGATTLAGRLARLVGEPFPAVPADAEPVGAAPGDGGAGAAGATAAGASRPADRTYAALDHLPVTAERLADASPELVAGIGLPGTRARCVVELARRVAGGDLPELSDEPLAAGPLDPAGFRRRFTELPGVGPWTAEYVLMRALRWPDAFPDGDLALRRAMGDLSPARLRQAAERWRPWRAYAAQHLWASLGDPVAGTAGSSAP